MRERDRYIGLAAAAVLLWTPNVAGAVSVAASQTPPTVGPVPKVVAPFYLVPSSRSAKPTALMRLAVVAVTRDERVTSACVGCGTTRFSEKVSSTRVTLRASPPLRMRPTTRIIVGVTAVGETGRWILLGFRGAHYKGLGHGCMLATVTALSPAAATHPAGIRFAPCGPPSPHGTEYVLWNGVDRQLYEMQSTARSWKRPPLPIGSGHGVRSAPGVLMRSGGERDVFWKGADSGLWVMSYTGNWSDAAELPQAGKLGSGPSAAVDAEGVVHLFWRGQGRQGTLWEMSEAGGLWTSSTPVHSGPVASAPAIIVRPNGTLDLFWKGTDRRLWEMPYPEGNNLARPISGAGKLGSAPAAVLDGNGVEEVFWRGTDGWLWDLSNPGNRGSISHQRNSGALGSAPSAVVHPGGVKDVFWRGTGGGLREMVWDGRSWRTAFPVRGSTKLGSQPVVALSP